jgi:hypothetical protein
MSTAGRADESTKETETTERLFSVPSVLFCSTRRRTSFQNAEVIIERALREDLVRPPGRIPDNFAPPLPSNPGPANDLQPDAEAKSHEYRLT